MAASVDLNRQFKETSSYHTNLKVNIGIGALAQLPCSTQQFVR